MHKYRKRPVVVEAFQMTEERRWDNSEWPEWLHEAWNKHEGNPGALFPGNDGLLDITTLEGKHDVTWGDFIIQGIQGELYPCKPEIFDSTYEKVARIPGARKLGIRMSRLACGRKHL